MQVFFDGTVTIRSALIWPGKIGVKAPTPRVKFFDGRMAVKSVGWFVFPGKVGIVSNEAPYEQMFDGRLDIGGRLDFEQDGVVGVKTRIDHIIQRGTVEIV